MYPLDSVLILTCYESRVVRIKGYQNHDIVIWSCKIMTEDSQAGVDKILYMSKPFCHIVFLVQMQFPGEIGFRSVREAAKDVLCTCCTVLCR